MIGMNNWRVVDPGRRLGEQGVALGRDRRVCARRRARCRLRDRRPAHIRSGTGAGTRPAKSTARPRRSARGRPRPRLAARSTLNPSAPQSAASRLQQQVGAGPLRKQDAERRALGLAEQPAAPRRSAPAAAGRAESPPTLPARVGNAVERRLEHGRARRQPGTLSAAISASRSMPALSSRRTSGWSSGPPARTGTSPNRPDGRIEAKAVARQLDALGVGQIGEGPAKHQVRLARRRTTRLRPRRCRAVEEDVLAPC